MIFKITNGASVRGDHRNARDSYRSLRGGHCRPRGGFRQPFRPREPERFTAPLGPLLWSISKKQLDEDHNAPKKDLEITDCKVLASYNWLDKRNASIIVPGMPPKWTPLEEARPLKEDAGTYFRDRNAARYPDHPMEPAIEAIMRKSQSTDEPIDIFCCGSTLGNLLRFASGDPKQFRILVEVVGGTVHFIRRENSPRETIPDVYGYGHTFPEAYTSWDSSARGSSSHQRILHYHFGGLSCLVRFEADGYLPDKVQHIAKRPATADSNGTVKEGEESVVDSLTSSLAENPVFPSGLSTKTEGLQISTAGDSIPQRAVFDLKTRTIRRKAGQDTIFATELPRLWVAQIPTLILAYHDQGTFNDINILDMTNKLDDWETENKSRISQLFMLLGQIIETAKARDDGKLEITRIEGDDVLCIREQMPDVTSAFSKEAEARWKVWLGADGQSIDGKEDTNRVHLSNGQDGNKRTDGLAAPSESVLDYTACDEECDYCGHCT